MPRPAASVRQTEKGGRKAACFVSDAQRLAQPGRRFVSIPRRDGADGSRARN